jgi:predicted nucleotidyltransferase
MSKQKIAIPRKKIVDFCQRWKVLEISLFGSALREDFHSDSDIDVLVTFAPNARISLFDLVDMENELKNVFGRDVDLVGKETIIQSENYIRRKGILANTKVIYAAG